MKDRTCGAVKCGKERSGLLTGSLAINFPGSYNKVRSEGQKRNGIKGFADKR